jgi:hypothetical protein
VSAIVESERCQRCGGDNICWHAPSDLWNAVMRDETGIDLFQIVCPQCFADIAEAQRGPLIWTLAAHDAARTKEGQ